MSIVPPSARSGARGGLAPIARRLHQAGVSANSVTIAGLLITTAGAALLAYGLPGAALLVLLVGSLADTLDGQIAKAESLGLGASVGLAPREARLVLLLVGVAAWAVTANSSLFGAAVAVVALLSTITVVQRLAHVAAALRNT